MQFGRADATLQPCRNVSTPNTAIQAAEKVVYFVILSEAKNLSVTVLATARTIACESIPSKTCHVYIMASASRVLYIGVTGDRLRRVREHKQMRLPGFTARYRVAELVYFEPFADIRFAIAREKQIKGWLRARKIALIESFNPHWRDLATELQSPTPSRVSF
jgi:putative endonuclease